VRLALVLVAAGLAAAVAGCGGSGGETTSQPPPPTVTPQSLGYTKGYAGAKRDALAAVAAYVAALRSGDGKTVCELTSRTDRALKVCRQTLASTFHPRGKEPDYHVAAVNVGGNHASVTLAAANAKPLYFTLVRPDGEWKILVVSNQGG
jgi:hypothetical protein